MTEPNTAMSHETTGFCFCGQMHGRIDSWNEHDWAALREYMPAVHPSPSPHPPTHEQIAAVMSAAVEAEGMIDYEESNRAAGAAAVEAAVLALIQNGADR